MFPSGSSHLKGKSVRVAIKDDRIKVEVESDGRFETLIDSELKWKIHPTNSFWALIPGDHVHIKLEKIQERWWDACFVSKSEPSDDSLNLVMIVLLNDL